MEEKVFFLGCVLQGAGKRLQTGNLIEAVGVSPKEDPAEALAGEKGGDLIGGGFPGKGDAEEEPGFLLGVLGNQIGKNGVGGPGSDGLRAVGAGELGEAGKKEFQVIGDFRDRSDSATGGAHGIGLAQCDGGWDPLDPIDAGPIHPFEELAGVGTEGFGIAALALGVESVEGERGFSRTGGAGENMEFAQRQIEGEILEVVLTRALDADGSGTLHERGRLAPIGKGTNDRLGLGIKNPILRGCNTGSVICSIGWG